MVILSRKSSRSISVILLGMQLSIAIMTLTPSLIGDKITLVILSPISWKI